jgi:hypothetical protein
MKSKLNKWSVGLVAGAARWGQVRGRTGSALPSLLGSLAASLCLCASVAKPDQQGYPQTFLSLTNEPALLATSASTGWTNEYIPLRTFSGLGMQVCFQATNSSATGNVYVVEWPSVDGTNAATVAPFGTQIYAANGTNVVIGCTNWSQLQLKGINGLFVNITNSAGYYIYLNTAITNWVNTNAPYPGGVLANRPNQ